MADSGRVDDAIALYDGAIALDPRNAFALGQRGMLLEVKGWPERAVKDYDLAIAAAPNDVVLRRARASLRMSAGKLREAADDLGVILANNPYDFMAISTRAAVHYALADHVAALEDLNTLIYGPKDGMPFVTGGPQLAGFLIQRAIVLHHLKRGDEAIDDMARAVDLGGKQNVLRVQIFLRRNGFPELPLDGILIRAIGRRDPCLFRQG